MGKSNDSLSISVYLNHNLIETIDKIATKQRRSRSQVIEMLLEKAVEKPPSQ